MARTHRDDPANVILRTVRDAWGAPRAPVGMSERCWINILFGRKCQICGQSAGGCSPITSAVLGCRVCIPCRSRSVSRVNDEEPAELVSTKSGRSFDIMSLVFWGDWTVYDDFAEPWTPSLWFCWTDELEEVKRNVNRLVMKTDEDYKITRLKLENYIKFRQESVNVRLTKVKQVREWMRRNAKARKADHPSDKHDKAS